MKAPEVVDDILEHYGTKGMRWGVRRAQRQAVDQAGKEAGIAKRKELGLGRVTSGLRPRDYSNARKVNRAMREARKEKKKEFSREAEIRKGDEATRKSVTDPRQHMHTKILLNNRAAEKANAIDIPRINNKPEWKREAAKGTFKDLDNPITKRYYNEHHTAYVNRVKEVVKELESVNPDAKISYDVKQSDEFLGFTLGVKEIKHAMNSINVKIKFITNDRGEIIGIELDEDNLIQSAIDDILAHHGVKGMRWGVRRKATVGAQEVIVSDKRKKVKTSGGRGHPAHSDAVRARTVGQIGKKSGLKALSNKDLQDYNNRLNLEMQAKRLAHQDSSAAKRFIRTMIGKKAPGAIETGGKAVVGSAAFKRRARIGASAIAFAVP